MPVPLYTQTVVAFLWDFDRTLIPGNMQDPIFEEYGVDSPLFWEEVEGLEDYYRRRGVPVTRDTVYVGHLLTYVREGKFPGLTNAKLRELGARLQLAPGMPEFIEATRRRVKEVPEYEHQGIKVEHYVVSTGLMPMVEGSALAPHLDGIWANTLIEAPAPPGYLSHLDVVQEPGPVSQIGLMIGNTAKTRAVFEINKGVNKNPSVDVNALMSEEQRRVPIPNMIYVADGPSDVPVFSILNERGGKTLGVYTLDPRNNFRQVKTLQEQGRIQGMAEADYRPGKAAYLWLMDSVDQIASGIVRAREHAFSEIPSAPRHA